MKSVLGLRLGAIGNLPPDLTSSDFPHLLARAGLMTYFDPEGVVTNHDAGVDKPNKRIYELAANKMKAAVNDCLYIGEDVDEVAGAQAAGMSAILKPFPPQA